jgi:hypothetical protein
MAADSTVTIATMEPIMVALARMRPLFHSEDDFKHAFAWQLHSTYPDARIRLETRPRPKVRLDVMALIGGRRVAIELKYLLRNLTLTIEDELFELPYQGAQDQRRYDFVKDGARLEVLVADGLADVGFAVALTNDASYWQGGEREDVADAAFRLGEGRALVGALAWAAHTGPGTMRDRESIIELVGSYQLQWRDFSQVEGGRNGTFRYLIVQVA